MECARQLFLQSTSANVKTCSFVNRANIFSSSTAQKENTQKIDFFSSNEQRKTEKTSCVVRLLTSSHLSVFFPVRMLFEYTENVCHLPFPMPMKLFYELIVRNCNEYFSKSVVGKNEPVGLLNVI